ncbi:hypothetical protein Zmor_025343 [Zophobas morio]|uniref:Uncharacterized protein n=1 Tax=Zophobas morio TaxID=2755281 RepID=A0AA38M4I2_9CUCU|nr:hypothetical protein Zmor_025343 [Zophobas morio]
MPLTGRLNKRDIWAAITRECKKQEIMFNIDATYQRERPVFAVSPGVWLDFSRPSPVEIIRPSGARYIRPRQPCLIPEISWLRLPENAGPDPSEKKRRQRAPASYHCCYCDVTLKKRAWFRCDNTRRIFFWRLRRIV